MREYNLWEFEEVLPPEPEPVRVEGNGHVAFTVPANIRDGERNTTLYRLGRSLKARGLSADAIRAAVEAENRARCQPPLDDGELADVVRQATSQPDRPDFRAAGEAPRAAAAAATEPTSEPVITIRTVADSLARNPESLTVKYLVKPWIPDHSIVVLTGAPGTSKGKFVQDLLIARAAGQPFLGRAIVEGPALFWSAEQGTDEDDRVMVALCRGRGLTADGFNTNQLKMISDPPLRFGHPAMLTRVQTLVDQHPGMLVVVDSIRRAFEGNENDSEVADRFLWSVLVPLRSAGATVLMLAHPPKPPAQGDLRLDSLIRGSGDWLAMIDSLLVLKASSRVRTDATTEDVKSLLIHHKARRGGKEDVGVMVLHIAHDDAPDLTFTLTYEASGAAIAEAQVVVEALANFFREKGTATRNHYMTHFAGRFSKKLLDPARDTLLRQGLIRKLDKADRPPGVRGTVYAWVENPTEHHAGAQSQLNEPADREDDDQIPF